VVVASADRAFPTFARGDIRTTILESFRYRLRQTTNPATGLPFDEADIQAATNELTKEYAEADAIDLVELAGQQRGLFLADQANPLRASDAWLGDYWATLWAPEGPLPASSGGGVITAVATPGTPFIGSTTKPDPLANKIRIGAVTYQVLYPEITDSGGVATLVVRALSTGLETNALAGAKAVWITPPPGASPTGITLPADFTGGAPAETASAFAKRIVTAIRYKQGAGNPPQMRAWARQASAAIEDAWVYSCALEAGSTIVAVTAARGTSESPTARIAGQPIIDDATAYITSPGSPVVPAPPFILALSCVSQPTNIMVALELPKKSTSGWTDLVPWPAAVSILPQVSAVTNQQDFLVDLGAALAAPSSTTPSLMVWDSAHMKFEALAVSSVVLNAGNVYRVQLSSAPAATIAVGLAVAPDSARRTAISKAARDYIDSLGPGELVDLATSTLAHRAYRWPPPDEEWPQRAGSSILGYLRDALDAASTDEDLSAVSSALPTVPADPADGPALLTLQHFGVYPL
jgi:hypothetical protein